MTSSATGPILATHKLELPMKFVFSAYCRFELYHLMLARFNVFLYQFVSLNKILALSL